jgi:hypothetical protein
MTQGDWCPGPALTGREVGRLRELKVLDTSQVLYRVFAVGVPHVDPVSEARAIVYRHFPCASASRFKFYRPSNNPKCANGGLFGCWFAVHFSSQTIVGPFDFLQYLLCVWILFVMCALLRKFRSFDVLTQPL